MAKGVPKRLSHIYIYIYIYDTYVLAFIHNIGSVRLVVIELRVKTKIVTWQRKANHMGSLRPSRPSSSKFTGCAVIFSLLGPGPPIFGPSCLPNCCCGIFLAQYLITCGIFVILAEAFKMNYISAPGPNDTHMITFGICFCSLRTILTGAKPAYLQYRH